MSAGGGYNDWESDLSSIIEKTNQNLKLLRRIGDKRSDLTGAGGYDVSTTATRPATATSAAQIASEMRSFASSISSRYAAEDVGGSSRTRNASTTGIPRATAASASASAKKLHRSSSMGVENARERARESLIIRPTTAFGSDGEGDGEERSPRRSTSRQGVAGSGSATRSSALKRSSSVATGKTKSSTTGGMRMSATASGLANGNSTSNNNSSNSFLGSEMSLDDLRKSLEVHVASRSSAFEKALGDLRTDMTVVTTETNALSMKMHELRDAVTAKLSSIASTTQAVSENGESIGRLEKHSAVLLGWKVGVDQDLFEISTKLKSFASIQEKMTSLESHLEALGAAIKNAHRAARYDEKIDELKDRLAMMERHAANQVDAKAVEHTVQMRVSKEINELENRIQQSLQFLTQKLENKLQALEKSVCSDRIDAIASVKSELMEDIDKLDSKTLKKPELVPVQNAQTQMKDDIAHMQMFFERQDKCFQELKQNSTQIRDELVETRHELTKALHAQQNRVSSTLEEKVAQLAVMSKDKNVKVDQKMALLEKRHKKIEDQTKALHEAVDKVKQNAVSRRAVDSVTQQRENEKLRQRLAKSIAELEQLHTAKQELERSMEVQERQYQTKIKDLRAQVEEQEKTKETQRAELLQAIQSESRQMGYSQGRNALLESLLSREKQENEEKSQQIHKARQEIAQIRQKMRSLESDVDRKMQKLSVELQSKQSQVDALAKKLKRSEEDAQKLVEAAKREKKSLARTKELKQQELVATKMKLKEMEKIITTVTATREAETSVSQQQVDHTARIAEVESKRKQLELLLTERHLEVQEMRSELNELKSERDELVNKHQELLTARIQELTVEYQDQIQMLERRIAAKDAEMKQLRGDLVDRSELLALDSALAQLRSEKESLIEQLKASQTDHERRIMEAESSLKDLHRVELDKLHSQTEERVREIGALQISLAETCERLSTLEEAAKLSEASHVHEVARLVQELQEARAEFERLVEELSNLEAEKKKVEEKLIDVQAALEATSVESDEQQDEVERLRVNCEELGIERQRLAGELKSKSEELTELLKLDGHHRERLAEVEKEQDEARAQLEEEMEILRQTLKTEREASTQSEWELQATIIELEAQLSLERKLAQEGVSGSSKLEAELRIMVEKLTASTQAENAVKNKLDHILQELSTLGAGSITEAAADPASALRRYVSSLTETHSAALAALAGEHEDAVKQSAADGVRVLELEKQMKELTTQIEELEDSNRELKADMERLCAEKARQLLEMGRLQEEISDVRDQKHALEDQVEQQLAKYEELDATLQSQIQEKDTELNELKEVNAGLEKTIHGIHETMEKIENSKMVELDGFAMELQELELQLVELTGSNASKASGLSEAAMEREFLVNQQAIASAGQQIRALHTKLCSGCSILELQDLKASLAAVEAKHVRYREESERDRRHCIEAEEQVLLNVEFLEALMVDSDGKQNALASKYVKTVPNLAAKLSQLQAQFHDAIEQCSLEAASSLAKERLTRGDENPSELPEEVYGKSNTVDEEFDEEERDEIISSSEIEETDHVGDEDELEASGHDLNESMSELEESHADSLASDDGGNREEVEDADVDDTSQMNGADSPVPSSPSAMAIQMDAEASSRADSCTVLLHSPTASLLDEPFQGFRSQPDRTIRLGDTTRAEPCTALPQSPTAALLQERFKPFSGGGDSCDNLQSDFDDDGEEDDDETSASMSQQNAVKESSTAEDLEESWRSDHGQSELHEDDDNDGAKASASMANADLSRTENHRHGASLVDEQETDYQRGSVLGGEADDELIDSGSDGDAHSDQDEGELHNADHGGAAGEDDDVELEREDGGLEVRGQSTTRGEPNESTQEFRQLDRRPRDEDKEDRDAEELLSDEDHQLDDERDGDYDGSGTHSGFNYPVGKVGSEFTDDVDAGLEESHSGIDYQGAGRDDNAELAEDSKEDHLQSTQDVEEPAAYARATVQETPLPRREETLGSTASNFDSQQDEENENDDETDSSMDSTVVMTAAPTPASTTTGSTRAVSAIGAMASAGVALSHLAALRQDSDEEEFAAARISVNALGVRDAELDDDDFDQIEDRESDYGVLSDDESRLSRDRRTQQLSDMSSGDAEEEVSGRPAKTTSSAIESPLPTPVSGITAALRKYSDEEDVDAGLLSLATSSSRRVEQKSDDEFDDQLDGQESASEIDEQEDSQLDAGSDFDELDTSRELTIESQTKKTLPSQAAVPVTPSEQSFPIVTAQSADEDDDEFSQVELTLDSRGRDGEEEFEESDGEFGQKDESMRQPTYSGGDVLGEDRVDDDFEELPPENPSTQLDSTSTMSGPITVPSLPLAALRKNSDDEDVFLAAQLTMNAQRRGHADGHDQHEYDKKEEGDEDDGQLESTEREEKLDEESDPGDVDDSQDFGDDVGLPSFDSPKRTLRSSVSSDRQSGNVLSTGTEKITPHSSESAPSEHEATSVTTAPAAPSSESNLHEDSDGDELEVSQASLNNYDGEKHADSENGDWDARSDSHQFQTSEHDELDASQQLGGSDVGGLDASHEEAVVEPREEVEPDRSLTLEPSGAVENSKLSAPLHIAALQRDSDEDVEEAGALSLASAPTKMKNDDEFGEDSGAEESVSEIDELDSSQPNAGSDFDDIDSSRDFGSESESDKLHSQDQGTSAHVVVSDLAPAVRAQELSALRTDSDGDDDSLHGDGMDENSIDASHEDADASQDFTHQTQASQLDGGSTLPGPVVVPSLSLTALKKNSDDEDEVLAAELTMNAQRRGDIHAHNDHEFDDEEEVDGDERDGRLGNEEEDRKRHTGLLESSEREEEHEDKSDHGDIDESQDFGDDIGLPSFQQEDDEHKTRGVSELRSPHLQRPSHSDNDDVDDDEHEFDQSASFDKEDTGYDTETRVSPQRSPPRAASAIVEDDRAEGDQSEDEDTDLRVRRNAPDESMDESMDEVERLLLQHAEQTELQEESDRRFSSSLRMEDEEDEQEGDELIDSEEEEEEIGGDSIRSDLDSEAATSPAATRQRRERSMSDEDAGETDNDEDDDDRDMDEMERLLEDATATPGKTDDRKLDADSSDEEEVMASDSSNIERPSVAQPSRVLTKNFDDSEEEDAEIAAAPSPVHLPSSQLLPLSGLAGRARGAGGGSGSLMKALNASRSALVGDMDELDDDMDEVERLMASQSLGQRKPLSTPAQSHAPVTSSLQTPMVHHDFDDEEEDDEDAIDRNDSTPPTAVAVNKSSNLGSDSAPLSRSHATVDGMITPALSRDKDKNADDVDEEDDDEEAGGQGESMDEESGTFGLSFGDDDLDRALASPTQKAPAQSTASTPALVANKQAIDDSDSDEDEKPTSSLHGGLASASSVLAGSARQLGSLQPLPSLGKKPLPGLGALGRASRLALDEDDEMDEVEKLLQQQTSMRTTSKLQLPSTTAAPASKPVPTPKDEDEDDEFDAESAPNSPLRRPDLPIAREEDDEFAHFDRDDDDDSDRTKDTREASSLSDSQGSAASPSRIPILRGSTLLKKDLSAPLGSVSAHGASPVARPRMASARSEDDYLEDSFDLEESLQEEVEEEEDV